MQITKITLAQRALLPAVAKKYIARGLSTTPADRVKVEDGIMRCYRAAGLKAPAVIIWVKSPLVGAFAAPIASAVIRQVMPRADSSAVRSAVDSAVRSALDSAVRSAVGSAVDSAVYSAVGSAVGSAVYSAVRSAVYSAVGSAVGSAVYSAVGSAVGSAVYSAVGSDWSNLLGGRWWLSYQAYLHALTEVCGWRPTDDVRERIDAYEAAQGAGWWWPFDGFAMVSEPPTTLRMDENGRLHSELGAAISWGDEWALHFWHGVAVPPHWIEQRSALDPNEVVRAVNVEQRAAGAAICGWPKMLSVLKAKVINDSGSADIGQLIELTLPGLLEPGRFLKAQCPRNGIIVEGVPRVSDIDGKPIETAVAAQAWRIGDPQSDYQHPPRRT